MFWPKFIASSKCSIYQKYFANSKYLVQLNHNKAIPEVYVLVLSWTDSTTVEVAPFIESWVLQEVCTEEKQVKVPTPSAFPFYFQAVLCEIVNFKKPYITA